MMRINDPHAALRKAFVIACKAQRRAVVEIDLRAAADPEFEWWKHPPRVADWMQFAGLRCGARTRAGTPCKRIDLYGCGRCRMHGGLSTGPRTAVGRARVTLNLIARTRPAAAAAGDGQ